MKDALLDNAKTSIEKALEFEGMTTRQGLALMSLFLDRVSRALPQALCFEFGTYRGRTSAIMAQHMSPDSWLHLVEKNRDYLEFDRIRALTKATTWHQTSSEVFCKENLDETVGDKKIGYTHHDASHFFDNVSTEMTHVERHMIPGSIMVLDDFNDSYSQVRAAYYHQRYVNNFPFELLLVGFNKAILVHQELFDEQERYVLDGLLDELSELGVDAMLCRTDINRHSRNFFLKPRLPDGDKLYGLKFWGDKFYKPSVLALSTGRR